MERDEGREEVSNIEHEGERRGDRRRERGGNRTRNRRSKGTTTVRGNETDGQARGGRRDPVGAPCYPRVEVEGELRGRVRETRPRQISSTRSAYERSA